MQKRLIPYDTCDTEWTHATTLAQELRQSGRYSTVVVRERQPENGRRFGRIFVQRKEQHDQNRNQP